MAKTRTARKAVLVRNSIVRSLRAMTHAEANSDGRCLETSRRGFGSCKKVGAMKYLVGGLLAAAALALTLSSNYADEKDNKDKKCSTSLF